MVILIADDDRLIRYSVKSMLGEILEEFRIIFLEARDGEEMVQLCKEHKPDIAFVDIRMPRLNGLDAIEKSRVLSGETEYVIVSGYSDFEYAQKGIRLGISEYLLKPVGEDELKDVMEKLMEKLQKKKEDSNYRFQIRVMDAFNGYMTDEDNTICLEENLLSFMFFMAAGCGDKGEAAENQKKILKKVNLLGKDIMERGGYYASVVNADGIPCILFHSKEKDYILSRMRKISLEGNGYYYFWWNEGKNLSDICVECAKLSGEQHLLLQKKRGTVVKNEELLLACGDEEKEFLRDIERFLTAWIQADGVTCKNIMNDIWRKYNGKKLKLNLGYLAEYGEYVTGCHIKSESVKDFCRSFVEESDRMYMAVHREDADVIEQVKKYLTNHYMDDVSISGIAESFNLTANYLSTIFHQKTGQKFVDYLTEIRIGAAKRLLLHNSSASVQDIALMVGYNSARHFSSVFQKQTGKTPTVYRKEKV